MRLPKNALIAALAGFGFAQSSMALQATKPATAPASTMPAGATALTATISSVKGIVQIRASDTAAWEAAKPGMKLDQGAEIRTGLRSAIQFTVGPDEVITLDRLGTVTVLQAFQNQGRAKTDIGMKYGRARYDIRDTNLQHESTIRSPGSTLALRGTDIVYEDQAPWVPQAISVNGRAEFRNFRRQAVAFGGKRRASIAADKSSPAQQALTKTKADPRGAFAGRTEAEDELVLSLQSIGGIDAQGLQALQDLARQFTGDSFTGIPNVTGPLEFSLTWTTAGGGTGGSNLDLLVTDPLKNVVSPSNPLVGSGSAMGQHSGDNIGAGGLGGEVVTWPLFFPGGTYSVQVVHQGGEDAVVSDFQVTQGGNQIKTFGADPDPAITLSPGGTFSGTVTTQAVSATSAARSRGRRNSSAPRSADVRGAARSQARAAARTR
jgi:hypothetical protein